MKRKPWGRRGAAATILALATAVACADGSDESPGAGAARSGAKAVEKAKAAAGDTVDAAEIAAKEPTSLQLFVALHHGVNLASTRSSRVIPHDTIPMALVRADSPIGERASAGLLAPASSAADDGTPESRMHVAVAADAPFGAIVSLLVAANMAGYEEATLVGADYGRTELRGIPLWTPRFVSDRDRHGRGKKPRAGILGDPGLLKALKSLEGAYGPGGGGTLRGGSGLGGSRDPLGGLGLGKADGSGGSGADGYAGFPGTSPGIGIGTGTGYIGGPPRTRPPTVKLGPLTVRGSLDKMIISRVLRMNLTRLRYCYEKELMRRPDVAGTAVLAFVISPEGAVLKSELKASSLGASSVEICLTAQVRRFKFPKPEGGGVVMVDAKLMFTRGKAIAGAPKPRPKKPKGPSPEEEWRKETLAMLAEDGGAPIHVRLSADRAELFEPDRLDSPFIAMKTTDEGADVLPFNERIAVLKRKVPEATRVLIAADGSVTGARLLEVIDALRESCPEAGSCTELFPEVALVVAPWLAVLP